MPWTGILQAGQKNQFVMDIFKPRIFNTQEKVTSQGLQKSLVVLTILFFSKNDVVLEVVSAHVSGQVLGHIHMYAIGNRKTPISCFFKCLESSIVFLQYSLSKELLMLLRWRIFFAYTRSFSEYCVLTTWNKMSFIYFQNKMYSTLSVIGVGRRESHP